MKDVTLQEFSVICRECDAQSLYQAALEYGKRRGKYVKDEELIIDVTSKTMISLLSAKTQDTETQQLESMRQDRANALHDFLYIYGGYIGIMLTQKLEKQKLPEIVEKQELIAKATEKILNQCCETLKNRYQEGKFSHLVNTLIFYASKNLRTALFRLEKKAPISTEQCSEAFEQETTPTDSDQHHFLLHLMYSNLRKISTEHTEDDREMFIRHYFKGEKIQHIADDFGCSIGTVSTRTKKFYNELAFHCRKQLEDLERMDVMDWTDSEGAIE